MEHTPGPWTLKFESDGFTVTAETGYGNERIALVSEDTGDFNEREADMGEANARLIAAAPALLDVLEEIHQRLDYVDQTPSANSFHHVLECRDIAQAAIAQAKGTRVQS